MLGSARVDRYAVLVVYKVARCAGFYGAIELEEEVCEECSAGMFGLQFSKGRLPRRQSVVVGRGDGQQRSQSAQSTRRPYRLARFTSSNKDYALSQNRREVVQPCNNLSPKQNHIYQVKPIIRSDHNYALVQVKSSTYWESNI